MKTKAELHQEAQQLLRARTLRQRTIRDLQEEVTTVERRLLEVDAELKLAPDASPTPGQKLALEALDRAVRNAVGHDSEITIRREEAVDLQGLIDDLQTDLRRMKEGT